MGRPVQVWSSISNMPRFDQALCKKYPAGWWDADASSFDHSLAKQICHECTHRVECALWAKNHQESGIWGGVAFAYGQTQASRSSKQL